MSKSSQRKVSAYQSGFSDGLLNRAIRWHRHPQLAFYEAGYYEGYNVRESSAPIGMTFIQRLAFAFLGKYPKQLTGE